MDIQWLEDRLESELQRQGALPRESEENAREGCPPTVVAPVVGPTGEKIWLGSAPPEEDEVRREDKEAVGSEDEQRPSGEKDVMPVATSDAAPLAAGPQGPGGHAGAEGQQLWEAIDKRIGQQIDGVEQRLSSVVTSSLSEFSASQREMMKHRNTLTKQVHDEAPFQRDVQRDLSARLDILSESTGRLGQHQTGPTRRKERKTVSQAAPGVSG